MHFFKYPQIEENFQTTVDLTAVLVSVVWVSYHELFVRNADMFDTKGAQIFPKIWK